MTVKEFAAQMFCTLRSQTIEDWEKMPEKAKKSFETLAGYTLSIVGSDEMNKSGTSRSFAPRQRRPDLSLQRQICSTRKIRP